MSGKVTGIKLRELRKRRGLTQAALARMAGVSASYLNLIENGKRSVGGALLRRLADALEAEPGALESVREQALAGAMRDIAADPAVRQAAPDLGAIDRLVAGHPDWAAAFAALHRAYRERDRAAQALADRLNNDPFLDESVHQMLSKVSAIRSTAEILESASEDPGGISVRQRARFHKSLVDESRDLAEVSRALADFFDNAEPSDGAAPADEQVDAFLAARGNYFEALEDAALRMRRRAGLDLGSGDFAAAQARLAALLQADTGAEVLFESAPGPEVAAAKPARGVAAMTLSADAPAASRAFRIAARLAQAGAAEALDAEIAGAPELITETARARARRALTGYVAGAILLPYAPFLECAEELRYDVDRMGRRFGASYEQVAHRLATMRRPSAEGVPFAFMRVDPSGFLTKRLPLPSLALPRSGGACPLWVVYRAFQTPETTVRQLADFPNRDRVLFIARAVAKDVGGFGRPRRLLSVMLACDEIYADRTVYGVDSGPAEPVGTTCALCVRQDCAHRQVEPLFAEQAADSRS